MKQILFLGDECQSASDVEIKHQPDADECLILEDIKRMGAFCLCAHFDPIRRLLQKKMTREHHDEVDNSQDVE